MVTHEERRKLIENYRDELSYRAGAVVKSTVCLLFLCALAAVGAQSDVPPQGARLKVKDLEQATLAQDRPLFREAQARRAQRERESAVQSREAYTAESSGMIRTAAPNTACDARC